LYVNPPDHAIVLCVDEKSQLQALNRTQPILPLAPGVWPGRPGCRRLPLCGSGVLAAEEKQKLAMLARRPKSSQAMAGVTFSGFVGRPMAIPKVRANRVYYSTYL